MEHYNPVPLSLFSVWATAAALAGVCFAAAMAAGYRSLLPSLISRLRGIAARFFSSTPAPAPRHQGAILINGVCYPTPEQAALILGITVEDAISLASHFGEEVWMAGHEPEVALRHRVLKVARSRTKKVFVSQYPDHQEAVLVSGRQRLPIFGRFTLGKDGDDAILRLVSASS